MPLFRRTPERPRWIDAPNDLDSYPPGVKTALLSIQSNVNAILHREFSTLAHLGIPLPTLNTGYTIEPSDDVATFVRLCRPVYQIPLYLPLRFPMPGYKTRWCFVFYENKEAQDRGGRDLNSGVVKVIQNFPHRWLSRNPYTLFPTQPLQLELLHTMSWQTSPDNWPRLYSPNEDKEWQTSPLTETHALSWDELESFHQRAMLFSVFPEGEIPGLTPNLTAMYYSGFSTCFSLEESIPDLTLPAPRIGQDYITLKILPLPDVPLSKCKPFFSSLRSVTNLMLFEIVTDQYSTFFQITVSPQDRTLVEQQIQLHFPDFEVTEQAPALAAPSHLYAIHATPLLPYDQLTTKFDVDPYQQFFGILTSLSEGDTLSLRVFIAPLSNEANVLIQKPLGVSIYLQDQVVEKYKDNKKLYDLPEEDWKAEEAETTIRTLEDKVKALAQKRPAWLIGVTLSATKPEILASAKTQFLSQYETFTQHWQVAPLDQAELASHNLPEWQLGRYSWNIVGTDELVAPAHFPAKIAVIDRLETVAMKSSLPPPLYTESGIQIGTSKARGKSAEVKIPAAVRDRHTYVVGKSGTGKSTLLYNCIRQDIEQGFGVAVIDPHGDLADDVLHSIPEHRVKDTIYFNAKDTDYPIGLNIMNAKSEDEIGILADDLLVTFKRLSESWGERMENILRYSFHSLLRYPGATLLDLKTILQRSDFRERVVTSLKHPALTDFWQYEYSNYPKDAAQPILNRMSKFTLSPTLSAILGQAKSRLNFFEIIQGRKILLVKIAKGEIGEDTAHLLGSLLVSQFQLAIMRRAALPKEDRAPYFLYVDEFQNFTTSAFEKILSEARKYKLCLTLAHQYISQLDEKTKNAILANVGTIVMFQSYPADAYALKPELGQYEPTDVTNLSTERHEALCKPATQSKDTFKFTTLAPLPHGKDYAQTIIEQTQQRYSRFQTLNQAEPSRPAVRLQPPQPKPREMSARATARFCPYCGNMLSASARFCPLCGKPTPGTGQLTPQAISKPIPEQPQPVIPRSYAPLSRPALALPKEFKTNQDRILYYLNLAEYLSTKQIITLCYSHLSKTSQKAAASRDLKQLVEAKRIKTQFVGKEKIFFVGKSCSPTTHNLAIRDLFAKIECSGFEIAKIDFCRKLGGLTPDLTIDFVLPDGQHLSMFFEYDAGTEGIAELESKIVRYTRAGIRGQAILFVYDTPERLAQAMRALPQGSCVHAVLGEFESLSDSAFHFAPSYITSLFF